MEYDVVEGYGGAGGKGFCEVSARVVRDSVGAGECGEGYGGGL